MLLHPDRHARAIVDLHASDAFGEHLDLAGIGVQRAAFGIVVELAVTGPLAGRFRHRHPGIAFFPELLERHVLGRARGFVGQFDVIHLVFAVGELGPEPELVGETFEDLVVRQALADRLDHLLHRVDLVVGIGATGGDVILFQRRGRGHDDIDPTGRRRPPDVDADDGFHLLQRPDQPVGILLVRHEVVAGVEDHLDVGVGVGLAVVEELLAGVFQRLGDPRGRNDLGDEVAALAHAHRRAVAALRHAAVAVVPREPEARTRLADLAGQRLEVDDGPIGHFAMLGTLDRPGPGDLRGRGGEKLGEFLDLGLVHAGDRGGPGRSFRRAVGLTFHIGDPLVGPNRVFVEIGAIFEPLLEHMVGHGEEQRGIGVGDDLQPLGVQVAVGRRALRVDRDELDPGVADLFPGAIHAVVGDAVFDAVVLDRVGADQHEHLGVVADDFPGGLAGVDLHVADHARQEHLTGARRPVASGVGAAAHQVDQAALKHVRAERAGVRPAAIGR